MDRGTYFFLIGASLVTAAAALLIAPYFVLDAFLISYIAFFVGGRALTKGELPGWISRKKILYRSRISQYAELMKTGAPTSVDALALNPFVKAVVSQKDPRRLTPAELKRLREATVNYEQSRPKKSGGELPWSLKG